MSRGIIIVKRDNSNIRGQFYLSCVNKLLNTIYVPIIRDVAESHQYKVVGENCRNEYKNFMVTVDPEYLNWLSPSSCSVQATAQIHFLETFIVSTIEVLHCTVHGEMSRSVHFPHLRNGCMKSITARLHKFERCVVR